MYTFVSILVHVRIQVAKPHLEQITFCHYQLIYIYINLYKYIYTFEPVYLYTFVSILAMRYLGGETHTLTQITFCRYP